MPHCLTWLAEAVVAGWLVIGRTGSPFRMSRSRVAYTGARIQDPSCPRRIRIDRPKSRSGLVREGRVGRRTRSSSWHFEVVRGSIGLHFRFRVGATSVLRRKIRPRFSSRSSTASFGIGLVGQLKTRLWIVAIRLQKPSSGYQGSISPPFGESKINILNKILLISLGVVRKWRHGLRGKGSMILWRHHYGLSNHTCDDGGRGSKLFKIAWHHLWTIPYPFICHNN